MTERIGGSLNKFFARDDTEQLDRPDLNERRRVFIQRSRAYLKPAIINKSGPLSNKELWIAVEKRPFDFLGNARCYEDHLFYDQLLEKAARNSVKEGSEASWTTLQHAYLLDGQPWAEEVIMAATEKSPPVLTIQFADRIKDKELRKKVLARANELLKPSGE